LPAVVRRAVVREEEREGARAQALRAAEGASGCAQAGDEIPRASSAICTAFVAAPLRS
jgi:hypothetical protein